MIVPSVTYTAPQPPGPGFGTALPSVKTPDVGSSDGGAGVVERFFDEPPESRHDIHSFGVQPGYRSTTAWDKEKESPHLVHVNSGMARA